MRRKVKFAVFLFEFGISAPRLAIGDQKYVIPAETAANADEAKAICDSRNMDVVSFETPKESDAVFDFVGALGLKKD